MVERQKVKEQYADPKHHEYHRHQYAVPKRSTVALIDFVRGVLGDTSGVYSAIDVGCGGGANIYHLSQHLPNARWVGLDSAGCFFGLAREFLRDEERFRLVEGDFYQLDRQFRRGEFDLAFSIQTLSWLPDYEESLKQMMAVTRGWIFITSLFSDFNVDAFSSVYEYDADGTPKKDSPYNYNVYSLGKFAHFCKKEGARDVVAADFVIDVDLPVPRDRTMGTYTVKDMGGRRIQFSGPLHMPWKMIAVKMKG